MAEKQEVASREPSELEPGRRGESDYALRPPVNIFEDQERIVVQLDMPGVSREHLHVRVDRDNLLIEGEMRIDMPKGMEAVYADVRSTQYRRSFTLSNELDHDAVRASMRDGVAEIVIPKRRETLPRKIDVKVD